MKTATPRLKMFDRVGASASIACAIHCALAPIAIALLPAVFGGLWTHDFEMAVKVFVTLLAITTLTLGWKRHKRYRAWMFLAPGLAFLWGTPAMVAMGASEAITMTIGGTLVAAAHLLNVRLNHSHVHDATCHHDH